MNGFSTDNIILLIVGLIFLYFVVKFVKGIIKTIITIILIFTLGISSYNIFIAKKSISYEINRYKIDYAYFKDLKDISTEVSKIVEEIKEGRNTTENLSKLTELKKQVQSLKHSDETNFIQDRYMSSLDGVILGCRAYTTAKETEKQVGKLNELTKGLDVDFKDILFTSSIK